MSIFDEIFGGSDSSSLENISGVENINGTVISGFNEYSDLSNANIENLLGELIPPEHLAGCPSIECTPSHPIFMSDAGILGFYMEGSHEIHISGHQNFETPANMEYTVMHEVGHNAYANYETENPQIIKEWERISENSSEIYDKTGLGYVSDYAMTDAHEDFSETYATYISDPELLEFMSPEKYNFMKQYIFGGTEYISTPLENSEGYKIVEKNIDSQLQSAIEQFAQTPFEKALASVQTSDVGPSIDDVFRCFDCVT